jgi:hypothetical protein
MDGRTPTETPSAAYCGATAWCDGRVVHSEATLQEVSAVAEDDSELP